MERNRTRQTALVCALSVVLVLPSLADASACSESKADLLIRATTVVDVRDGELLEDRDVVVAGGRICAIYHSRDHVAPDADTVVDGRGHFLIPGLMEMHGHVNTAEAMSLYLANGVTTVRNLWGEAWTLALKKQFAAAPGAYPTLITAGPIIDGAPPINYPFVVLTDPRDADAEVARQAAAGYDFVKIYSNMSPGVFDAVIAAGEKYGIEISGHLPHDVAFPHALDRGMRTMEHFIEVADELLRYPPTPGLDLYVVYPETEHLLADIGRGELRLEDIIDRSRMSAIAEHAAGSETWFSATLMPMRNFTSDWNQPNADWDRYLPPATRAYWERAWAARARWSADARRGEDQLYALRLELLAAMHKAGAKVLAGTDAPVPGMYHGFSLVDEIEQLTRAGLSNADALRAATLEGARYLRREGQLGEVVVGADADLVLLEENPLEDLQNLRSIAGVVRAGHWHDAATLEGRLETIAAGYAHQEARFDNAPTLVQRSEVRRGEPVRTTAARVENEAADFLAVNADVAARLMVQEEGQAVELTLATRNGSGDWAQLQISASAEGVTLSRQGKKELTLRKVDGEWQLKDGREVLWRLASGGLVLPLTGTPADIVLLDKLGDWAGSSSTPLHVWECDLSASCDGRPVPAFAERAGFEKINAVFSGADRIELSARGLGKTTVWVGAGPFYSGQPIRSQGTGSVRWERLR